MPLGAVARLLLRGKGVCAALATAKHCKLATALLAQLMDREGILAALSASAGATASALVTRAAGYRQRVVCALHSTSAQRAQYRSSTRRSPSPGL